MLYGLYAGREAANDANKQSLSYDIVGLNLGSQLIVNPDLSLSAGLVYEQHRYSVKDTLFLVIRSDVQQAIGIAADYRLAPRWHLLPRYTYTHNVSNTALSDYIRNTYTLQLKWDFDNENQ
jgi:lipopolysaccharide assembly outer membrane protein LptD (OstA)